ncbi:MAG: hypothetical protein AAGK78_03290, partial [Planctomycetota bacterium]
MPVGVDIGHDRLRLVQLSTSSVGYAVHKAAATNVPEGHASDLGWLTTELPRLWARHKLHRRRLCLSPHRLL